MEHSSRKAEELKSTELVKRKEIVLSYSEQSELERNENLKNWKLRENKRQKNAYETEFQLAGAQGFRRVLRGWTAVFHSEDSLQCSNLMNVPSKQSSPTERECLCSNVVNISSRELSTAEVKRNFCPFSGSSNEFELYHNLDNFVRNLRLWEYLHGRPSESKKLLLVPSDKMWTPNEQRDKHLELYISAVQKDIISDFKKRLPVCGNLAKDECEALGILSEDTGIVIKPADKGTAVVIMNKNHYLEEGQRQLPDETFYHKLPDDPTLRFEAEIADTLPQAIVESVLCANGPSGGVWVVYFSAPVVLNEAQIGYNADSLDLFP